MKFNEIIILLPCHSLEDFPVHYEGQEAENLLACWTTMWHPALIASAEKIPAWHRADDPPEDLAGNLLVVPEVSSTELQAGFIARAEKEGARVIRGKRSRDELISASIEGMEDVTGSLDAELTADFLAVGYAFLQVELLTRQMRYMSNIDEVHFGNLVVEAAKALIEGETQAARDGLQKCFDLLTEAREHFYPVDSYLVDLTLVASTTLGESLCKQLQNDSCSNLLISGEIVQLMAVEKPATLAALRTSIAEKRTTLVGGERIEAELPLMTPEDILDDFQSGLAIYEKHLGARPHVFGRRKFGLTPVLPQILSRLGFVGALHSSFENGTVPTSEQGKISWEGNDGTCIDAFSRNPIDATQSHSFLNLSVKIGEAMDSDHVATVCFAHWPGKTSPWYEDLRRISAYAPVLGKFISFEEYFNDTDTPGSVLRFEADQYRSPYLMQSVADDLSHPVALSVQRNKDRIARSAHSGLLTLQAMLSGEPANERSEVSSLDQTVATSVRAIATSLTKERRRIGTGCLVLNPCSYARRAVADVSEMDQLPSVTGPVIASQQAGDQKLAIVEVPSMGFVWIAPTDSSAVLPEKKIKSKTPDLLSLVEENVLRNEHIEAKINPLTGSLAAFRDYKRRGNLLSQQLGMRLSGRPSKSGNMISDPADKIKYSVMACDSMVVTANGPAVGEITARGRLLDLEGEQLALFEQIYRLYRGSRVLILDIRITDAKPSPKLDPWFSYYASRFAWSGEELEPWRSVSLGREPTETSRIEAPHYIELDSEKLKLAILTCGVPYHLRIGSKKLDTLLLTGNDTSCDVRLAIGTDLRQPVATCLGLSMPLTSVCLSAQWTASSESGWLVHIDARNVIVTHWEPVCENDKVVGIRLRALETRGRRTKFKIRLFRAIVSARQLELDGQPLVDIKIEDDQAVIDLTEHEWVYLECRWEA